MTFTFIEIMVILIIMAVLAAIALPQMGNFYQNTKLNSTVHRFRLFLNAARVKALTSGSECRFVIRPGWRKIYLEMLETDVIKSPEDAVEYIKKLESKIPSASGHKRKKFARIEGDFSGMDIPEGIKINYISVSGRKRSSLEEVVISFNSTYYPDAADFSFEDRRGEYKGLRLEAGSGMVKSLEIIKED